MFDSKFLNASSPNAAAHADAVLPPRQSKLFTRRVAMRCNVIADNDCPMTVSPMTASLVSVAEKRTACPEVPSISGLNTANVEPTTETHDVASAASVTRVKKAGRKPKTEVGDVASRKRSPRTKSGSGVDEAGVLRKSAQSENSL